MKRLPHGHVLVARVSLSSSDQADWADPTVSVSSRDGLILHPADITQESAEQAVPDKS